MLHLRGRFSIASLATTATLVPLLVIGITLITISRNSARRLSAGLADALVEQTVQRVQQSVDRYIAEVTRMSDILATGVEKGAIDSHDMAGWQGRFDVFLDSSPEVGSLAYADLPRQQYIRLARTGSVRELARSGPDTPDKIETLSIDAHGQPVPGSSRVSDFSEASRPWFRRATSSTQPTWTDLYTWYSGKPTTGGAGTPRGIAYARRVHIPPNWETPLATTRPATGPATTTTAGADEGILAIGIQLDQIREFMAQVAKPMGAALIISDASGHVIASSDPHVPVNWPAADAEGGQDAPGRLEHAVAAMLRTRGRAAFLQPDVNGEAMRVRLDGRDCWVAERPISVSPTASWNLLVAMPEPPIVGHARADTRDSIWFGSVCVGLAGLISTLLARRLARPIRRLAQFSTEIGRGNFEQRARPTAPREVAELSDALNNMARALQERVALLSAKEAAEQAGAAKAQLIAHVSHEFRTPLNAIVGYAELLRDAARDEGRTRDAQDAGNILLASRQLLELVENILDLSRVEAGRMPVNVCDFAIADLVRGVLNTIRPAVERNGNQLQLDVPEPRESMSSDPARLTQVLINVMGNAAKFTHDGRVTLRVHADVQAVRFEVIDTGTGIDPNELPRVFDAFAQAHTPNASSRQPGGAGLGLAITRQLCELLHGKIEIRSTPGAGTHVTVTMPRELPAAAAR